MKPFFSTPERIAALLFESAQWIGTPWMANSEQRGTGVACHLLPTAIYIGCGAIDPDFPKIRGNPTQTARESLMVPFLDARPELRHLADDEPLQPGDLVGLRIRRHVDHLGIVLERNFFIHVLMHKFTDTDLITVSPWHERREAAWRVMEI